MNYIKHLSTNLKKKWIDFNVELIECSNNKLGQLLGTTKDKIEKRDKSGIYKIEWDDCEEIYIGQSRRAVKERFDEHLKYISKQITDKSAVAKHSCILKHNITLDNCSLIKEVHNPQHLDAIESWHIKQNKKMDRKMMNADEGPIISCLMNI